MRTRASIVLAVGLSVAGVTPALGQARWGSPATPRTGVCFYQDANFQGQYFCAGPGQNLSTLPRDMRDKISSIRILGRAQATVFKDERFRGASARFNTDVRNLKNEAWNDTISSIRIESDTTRWQGPQSRTPEWGRATPPRDGACFYQDPNYSGKYFCMPRGTSYDLVPDGFNDKISSIRIMGGGVMIFVDRDFGGRSLRVASDVPKLQGSWNDKISSIRVF